ncbi:MAG TPA: 50S ribosomal protein L4, partial [Candidatus Dojkabacteria bacterium]|nr:50S ribosomal protein L4 [Candidatus Dojkabacteria bacterium]
GGVTFGPSNIVNYKKSFNKKMLKKAFQSAFSYKAHNQNVKVFAELQLENAKTKALADFLKKSGVGGKSLIIQNQVNKDLLRVSRNLPDVRMAVVNEINPYQILDAKEIVILADVLPVISKNWGQEKKEIILTKKILVRKTTVGKKTLQLKNKIKAKK